MVSPCLRLGKHRSMLVIILKNKQVFTLLSASKKTADFRKIPHRWLCCLK